MGPEQLRAWLTALPLQPGVGEDKEPHSRVSEQRRGAPGGRQGVVGKRF
jgi:hypothetical protein